MSFTITIACILILCSICQWVAWRIKLPAIIFLLLAGIVVGPVFRLVNPNDILGPLFFPFISFSVAIILCEGGLQKHTMRSLSKINKFNQFYVN